MARGEHRRGAEGRSDTQIGRRAERTTTNRGERIEARRPNAPHVDERMTRREDGKTQHRDAVRGAEGRDRRQERRPEVKAAADTDASGTLSPEERSAYKERVQTTHQEVKSSRHDLAVEHTKEYQALKAKYDANGDGQLNRDEWQAGKAEFKQTFGENVAEDMELHQVNQGKRQSLLEPPTAPPPATPVPDKQ